MNWAEDRRAGMNTKNMPRLEIDLAKIGTHVRELVKQLYPRADIEILGASSDHWIALANTARLRVGDEVAFDIDYGAMLAAMTSPYVQKVHLNGNVA